MRAATRWFAILLACLAFTGCKPREEPRYKTPEHAVEAGFVDASVVKSLREGKPVKVFLLFDPPPAKLEIQPGVRLEFLQGQLRDRYSAESTRRKAQLRKAVRELEVVRDYAGLPITLVQLNSLPLLILLMNDPLLLAVAVPTQHDLYLGESVSVINASTATTWGQRGSGVGVALLDSGVNFTMSPTFSGCTTPGVPGCRLVFAKDIGPDDGMNDDATGHGTAMAEIIGTVAMGASLLSFDVVDSPGKINDADAIEAIREIIDKRFQYNIHVINMSFGTPSSFTSSCSTATFHPGGHRNAYGIIFPYLRQLGILPVVAAGNDAFTREFPHDPFAFKSGISWPACTAEALSVSAVYDAPNAGTLPASFNCTDASPAADAVPCFAQTGPTLKMYAPGSTVTVGTTPRDGTSPAAAMASAGAAVLYGFRASEATTDVVETALTGNGPTITDSRNNTSARRLDIPLALASRAWPLDNDNQAGPLQMTGSTPAPPRVNWLATAETSERNHAGQAPGASLWYAWTAPHAGTFSVATSGSDFDTVLAVYRNVAGTLFNANSNDDESVTVRTSRASFPSGAGESFLFAVDGKRTGMNIPPQRGVVRIAVSDRPSNDNVADAHGLTLGAAPQTGHNFSATKQQGELDHCGNDGGASVWFKVTNTGATRNVTASTTSASFFQRCLTVYRMTPTGLQYVAGGLWATPDDIYNATFSATQNEEFLLAVDGMSSEEPGFDAPARGEFAVRVQ